MRSTIFPPAACRRPAVFGLMLAVALVLVTATGSYAQPPQTPPAAPAAGQQPPAQPPAGQQPPAQQQQAAAPGRVFGSDAGIIFNPIKPDKTADFETIVAKLKDALAKSQDPVRKQQAASWKVFKSLEPGPGGNVLYLFIADPAVKGADYTVSKILAEAFPNEVQELFKVFAAAYGGGQSLVNLQLVADMK